MAYAVVQNNSANSNYGTGSVVVPIQNTPAQGNLIIVSIRNGTNNSTLTSVVDGNSNAFTKLSAFANFTGSNRIDHYGLIAGASQSTSFTATLSGAGLAGIAYEFSGNPSSIAGIVDVTGTGGSATSVTTTNGVQPSAVTTNSGDLILTSIELSNTGGTSVWSPTDAFTQLQQFSDLMADAYLIPGITGTYNPSFSWTTARVCNQILTALKPAVTPSTSGLLTFFS